MNAKQAQALDIQDIIEESYDEFPYETYVYPATHPDRMHTVATLFGLTPPAIETARVLEMGCAGGGNLIPLAAMFPKAEFLGIDLSREQVAQAEKSRKDMKLKNIQFKQMDILKFGPDLGKFDYIICHGVFSWVPDAVREKIFDICRNQLTPNGLATITYNTLPGWSAVKSIREMMLYHTKNFKEPAQQIHEAKSLLNFLYENATASGEFYRQIIDSERKILSKTNDSYIFHDHLEAENHQFYLYQFADMLKKHKLAYVGDAEISGMFIGNFSQKVQETFSAIKDIIRQEQYIDFLTNRRFRSSIVTHEESVPKISRNIDHSRILDFYVAARFQRDMSSPEPVKFVVTGNPASTFTVHDKASAAVFQALADKNGPFKIEDLANELKEKENIDPQATRAIFLANGFTLVLKGFLNLHAHSFSFTHELSKKPRASAWARYQATAQKERRCVTNLKSENITLNPFSKSLLSLLDGKNDKEALIKKLMALVANGELKVQKNNQPLTDGAELEKIIRGQVEESLPKLASCALLEA